MRYFGLNNAELQELQNKVERGDVAELPWHLAYDDDSQWDGMILNHIENKVADLLRFTIENYDATHKFARTIVRDHNYRLLDCD